MNTLSVLMEYMWLLWLPMFLLSSIGFLHLWMWLQYRIWRHRDLKCRRAQQNEYGAYLHRIEVFIDDFSIKTGMSPDEVRSICVSRVGKYTFFHPETALIFGKVKVAVDRVG